MKRIQRMLSLMLTICLLLPLGARAQEMPILPGTQSFEYHLALHMDPEAFPSPKEPETLQGVADLVNILSVSGVTSIYDISFDTRVTLMLNQAEDTKTSFHIFGPDSHWMLESSLLGEERVYFNLLALLEFAMKGYFHLGLPLQLPALLVSPYVHTTAFSATRNLMMNAVGDAEQVTLTQEQLLALAESIKTSAETDRALSYWIKAVLLDAGYDETVEEWLRTLPEWVRTWGAEGLTITRSPQQETWSSGDVVLFERSSTGEATSWKLHLPAMNDGNQVDISCTRTTNGIVQQLQLTLRVASQEEELLNCTLSGTDLPLSLAIPQEGRLDISLMGPMAGKYAGQHQLLFQGDGEKASIQWMNVQTNKPMIWADGTISAIAPSFSPFYPPGEVTGVNLLSVNDESLKDFVAAVTPSFTQGMLPILMQVPASAYQAIYQLLDNYGILSLLTADLEEET